MNNDRLHSRRMTMMALAIEIMEVLHKEGHTVRSALAELGSAPRPGRGATWRAGTFNWGWPMAQVERVVPPLPWRGRQGLWDIPDELLRSAP